LQHGKTFCALPRAPEDCEAWHRNQVGMFILGDDRGISRRAMADHLARHQMKDSGQWGMSRVLLNF
jgi:4-hydroxy-2-oxoheptanedioate aldolase